MKNTALLIMAAGIGSRFGGGIKQLEPVGLHNEIINIGVRHAKQLIKRITGNLKMKVC